MLKIEIINGEVIKQSEEKEKEKEVHLVYNNEYAKGDAIRITVDKPNGFYVIQLDDAIRENFVYLTDNTFTYEVPFGEKKISHSPKCFYGKCHVLFLRYATTEEIEQYKNLCLNKYDINYKESACHPHADANVETRGESVFAAKNAINGNRVNTSHGAWPYESWGINRDDNAKIKVDFGRDVFADKIVMYTRADFPHDNWWSQVTVTFSDNSQIVWDLEKGDNPHVFYFDKKVIRWVELSNLIKSGDPSPFPALTQLEVYGVEAM
jgi:hypothetical protein|nr:carbohydrate-binding protein [uncultured Lachnoclostridium sp.]